MHQLRLDNGQAYAPDLPVAHYWEIRSCALSENCGRTVMRNSSLMTFINCALWVLLLGAVEPIQAQQSDRPRRSVTVHTDLVVTWAQILDRKDGKVVKGLEIDDFLLREEGNPQQISLVKEGQPVSVVILVNGMACIWPPEHEFRRSREALHQLGDDAEIALMAWDSDVALVQPLTRDRNVIADRLEDRLSFFHALNGPQKAPRLERVNPRPGEAIYQAARYLEKAASPGHRRIIVFIAFTRSWMAETHPHTAAEVKELLEKTGTSVYGLYHNNGGPLDKGLFSESSFSRKSLRRHSGGTLEQFVELTGGSMLVGQVEEADELLIKLTGLIRSSYTIGYYPENSDFDGRFRRISLELSGRGKAKAGKANIKTRNGYRALRPSLADTSEMKN